MTDKIALNALRIVEEWLAVDSIDVFDKVNELYEVITSSTADEQYMLSFCLSYIFGQPETTFQIPVYLWSPGCDAKRI